MIYDQFLGFLFFKCDLELHLFNKTRCDQELLLFNKLQLLFRWLISK